MQAVLNKKEVVSILKDDVENSLNDSPSPSGIRTKEAASLVLRQPLLVKAATCSIVAKSRAREKLFRAIFDPS